jgi:DNA-binding NarL/FixJ family response regulator
LAVPTILLVVADIETRRCLRTAFAAESSFAICTEAENPLQAFKEAERAQPSLVILDLATTLENTLQLARHLREIVPRVPVFMLTNQYDCRMEKRALSAGITAVFSSSEDPGSILANARAVSRFGFGKQATHGFIGQAHSSVLSLP